MRLDGHLSRRPENFQPLTPVDFMIHAVNAHPDRLAVIWRERRWSYREFAGIAARLSGWLESEGLGDGNVVSIMCHNRPEMLAAHYAVPAIGAVLNTINTRLDAETISYILDHSESRILIVDQACADVAREAVRRAGVRMLVLADDGASNVDRLDLLTRQTEELRFESRGVTDEWQLLALNYTSGTTGHPKGVVYHHRGAYLNALGNVLALGLDKTSVYLWTLPMFHCNGWCHTWAVTAAGGVHVCLDRVDPTLIFRALSDHGVTHFACAPVVLYMLLNHPDRALHAPVRRALVATGGASPTSALIQQLDALGIDIIHLYGLTESFGPATCCALPDTLAFAEAGIKAAYLARQGVSHVTASRVRVADDLGNDIPADCVAMGEIVLSGNTLMAGYYKDKEATEVAFRDGWFHTGDLAVRHPDGAIEIKDRSKDIIISGGENISSLEVESILHQHPAVLLAAVVAATDDKWSEVPCAFIELKPGTSVDIEELRTFCRERLAGYKVPRRFMFQELPKTATGKIQKFQLRKLT
ncbi:MAG: AMP-binding protein [Hyphomicrobiales bacterium]|nr:AMP-binding protein [Hyphomicrobiales bacterium]